jgi:hypothetical protein
MRPRHAVLAVCAAAAAVVVACGDPFGLPRAVIANVVDTVSLYALHGTSVALPSGYRIEDRRAVRTDQALTFDFAFDLDSTGQALLFPTGALGLGSASGGQIIAAPFDSILIAPTRDFELDSAIPVDVGTVLVWQSRLVTCSFGIPAFYYAKLQVLDVDTVSTTPDGRRIQLRILVDRNCGYRGLEPGLPVR